MATMATITAGNSQDHGPSLGGLLGRSQRTPLLSLHEAGKERHPLFYAGEPIC